MLSDHDNYVIALMVVNWAMTIVLRYNQTSTYEFNSLQDLHRMLKWSYVGSNIPIRIHCNSFNSSHSPKTYDNSLINTVLQIITHSNKTKAKETNSEKNKTITSASKT